MTIMYVLINYAFTIFGEISIKLICLFFNGVVFLLLSFKHPYSGVKFIIKHMTRKNFQPVHDSFHFLNGVFGSVKVLNFDQV